MDLVFIGALIGFTALCTCFCALCARLEGKQ
jgi:hypothetical protein